MDFVFSQSENEWIHVSDDKCKYKHEPDFNQSKYCNIDLSAEVQISMHSPILAECTLVIHTICCECQAHSQWVSPRNGNMNGNSKAV